MNMLLKKCYHIRVMNLNTYMKNDKNFILNIMKTSSNFRYDVYNYLSRELKNDDEFAVLLINIDKKKSTK